MAFFVWRSLRTGQLKYHFIVSVNIASIFKQLKMYSRYLIRLRISFDRLKKIKKNLQKVLEISDVVNFEIENMSILNERKTLDKKMKSLKGCLSIDLPVNRKQIQTVSRFIVCYISSAKSLKMHMKTWYLRVPVCKHTCQQMMCM